MTPADNKTIELNEFQCVMGAAAGNRNPCEAGIIIGGEKYMLAGQVDPVTGLCQLTKKGGGAAIMKTATGIIVALFTKDKPCIDPATGAAMKGKF